MASQKCNNPKCTFDTNGHCFENADPIESCTNLKSVATEVKKKEKIASEESESVLWSGNYFNPSDISKLSGHSNPQIIGLVGNAKAAKTSYLAMLYTLLLNGHFLNDLFFSNSYTLSAWENLAFALRFNQGEVLFPEATPSNPDFYSIYHLGIKYNNSLKNVLFADASGEVFGQWAINVNDTNASNVRWIHQNADGFIFFIDCEALINGRSEAKENILDIANRLKENLKNRPVVMVWSKADRISEVRTTIKQDLEEELKNQFGDNATKFEVSNHTLNDPDPNCHINNLAVFEWLFKQINVPSNIHLELDIPLDSNDLFLNYRK